MKAWCVKEADGFCATVVFAETRGKAKVRALSTGCCEDADFCDIVAYREPRMDKYYADGKTEMDWYNPQDRIALVKECGFVCDADWLEYDDCESCPAAEYCDQYKDRIAEMEGDCE